MNEPRAKLRPARRDEARLLSDLALNSKAHWNYSAEFLAQVRDELSYRSEQIDSPGMRFVVAEVEGAAVGFYVAAGFVLTGTRESGSIPGRMLPTFAIDLGSR